METGQLIIVVLAAVTSVVLWYKQNKVLPVILIVLAAFFLALDFASGQLLTVGLWGMVALINIITLAFKWEIS